MISMTTSVIHISGKLCSVRNRCIKTVLAHIITVPDHFVVCALAEKLLLTRVYMSMICLLLCENERYLLQPERQRKTVPSKT